MNAADLQLQQLGRFVRHRVEIAIEDRDEIDRNRDEYYRCPRWTGEQPIAGASLLVHCEYGFGDSMQFARYLPLTASLGATIKILAPAPLRELFTASFGALATCASFAADAPRGADFHVDMIEQPAALRAAGIWVGGDLADELHATHLPVQDGGKWVWRQEIPRAPIPAACPYLWAPVDRIDKWKRRIGQMAAAAKPVIGFVWSCDHSRRWSIDPLKALNEDPLALYERACPIELLAPLFGNPAVQCLSLQAFPTRKETAVLREWGVPSLGSGLADFADTAAAIQQLAAVVSCDTATAHLAGAFGARTIVLLNALAPEKWSRDLYPSAIMCRQPAIGDWTSAVASAADYLLANCCRA